MWEELFPGVRKKEQKMLEKEKEKHLKMLRNNEKNLHKSDTLIILTVEDYYYPEQTLPKVINKLINMYSGKHLITYIFDKDNKYKQPHKIIEITDYLEYIYSRCEIIEHAPLLEERKLIFTSDYLNLFGDKYENIFLYIINLLSHIDEWKKIIYVDPISLCYTEKIK